MGAGSSKSPPSRSSSYKISEYSEYMSSPDSNGVLSSRGSTSSMASPGSPSSPSRSGASTIRRKRSAIEEIRLKAEQTANLAAERRFAQKQNEINYPGMPTSPLKKRDKMLLSISVTQPRLLRLTSSAITLKWMPEQSGGAARIKRYQLQWRIDTPDSSDLRTIDGWVNIIRYEESDNGNKHPVNDRLHFSTDSQWHSIPEDAVNVLKLEASVCGLKSNCFPAKFRVRGRCNAGWGPWSEESQAFKTLGGDIPAPAFSSLSSSSFEMRWQGLKDKRYGKLKAYVLMGKTENEEDTTWRECYRGMQPKVLVTRIGDSGLVPKTKYLFKVNTIASHGPDSSRDDSLLTSATVKIETLGTTPSAPRAPRIVSVSHESITVSWIPPCSNGSSITAFQLMGKMGHSKVYTEWYTGPNTKFTVGSARSTAMNFSTTKIISLTEYNMKVAASNAYGMSPFSTPVMAVTDPPPDLELPDAPPVAFADTRTDYSVSNVQEFSQSQDYDESHHTDIELKRETDSNPSGESKHSPSSENSSHGPRRATSPTLNNKNVRSIEGGWLECWDTKEHAFYYFHPHSGCTQWEHPSTVQKADASLVFRRKRFRFLYLLQKGRREADQAGDVGASQPVLPLTVNRAQVVYTSFSQLRSEVSSSNILVRVPKITFAGEAGIDSGGVSKDWFLSLSRAISDPQLCLFRFCKGMDGVVCVIDPRSSINQEHLEYFRFIGRILGMVSEAAISCQPNYKTSSKLSSPPCISVRLFATDPTCPPSRTPYPPRRYPTLFFNHKRWLTLDSAANCKYIRLFFIGILWI